MERGECPHGFSFSCPECHVKPREIAQARADVRHEAVEESKKADKRIAALTAELAAVKAERDALLGEGSHRTRHSLYWQAMQERDAALERCKKLEKEKENAFWHGWGAIASFIAGARDCPSMVEDAAGDHGVTLGLLIDAGCDEYDLNILREKTALAAGEGK